jgi:hypothetical protein
MSISILENQIDGFLYKCLLFLFSLAGVLIFPIHYIFWFFPGNLGGFQKFGHANGNRLNFSS